MSFTCSLIFLAERVLKCNALCKIQVTGKLKEIKAPYCGLARNRIKNIRFHLDLSIEQSNRSESDVLGKNCIISWN
uniref:Uncharacterized protein n=1 Tax=Anguilla anguilla TaxID=7936 RepID=A0A0E9XHB6_ANGAN